MPRKKRNLKKIKKQRRDRKTKRVLEKAALKKQSRKQKTKGKRNSNATPRPRE